MPEIVEFINESNDWIHDVLTSQVSLEDKLNAISLAQTQSGSGKTEQPNLNSMVTLLTQALQSQDKNLLLVSLKHVQVKVIF